MADNFTFKDASATTLTAAADEIGGIKFERFKLTAGKDGENVGDVGGSLVDTDRVAVYTRERSKIVELTSNTVDTAAYSANDCMGGKITLANAVAAAGDGLRIDRIFYVSKINPGTLTFYLFNANPTTTTFSDNGAFPTIDDADMGKLRFLGPLTAVNDGTHYSGTVSRAHADSLPDMVLTGTSLYLAIKTAGTPDFVAATDFYLSLTATRL